MKRIQAILLALIAALLLTACGGSAQHGGASPAESGSDMGWNAPDIDYKREDLPAAAKMIFTGQIELETLTFDQAVSDIGALVENVGGYYEEQSVSGYASGYRYANYVIRVPSEQFSRFCREVGDVCHTLRVNTSQENISESYYDTESRLNTAKTKLARLQELLSRAESLEDIITIESAIADTEQTIDRLSGTLRSYDNLVDYATVRVSLQEVYRLSGTQDAPLTLGQRIGNAFTSGLAGVGDFFEGLLVFLAYAWFWLLLLAAIVVVVIAVIRRRTARRRRKKAESIENSRPE
ncbi:MAG: DUF4349 domain-containing protein [Oscillospiraceae bacterium]|nr:DUF4349 domain-containing protein [Oscillospiraceae bacterium]